LEIIGEQALLRQDRFSGWAGIGIDPALNGLSGTVDGFVAKYRHLDSLQENRLRERKKVDLDI